MGNVISGTLAPPLSFDSENALQRCGGDPQPLGHGDVILHGLGNGLAAHHQHMGATQQVSAHIDAALMLLWDGIVEEQGQIQCRADGRKARLIHRPAIPGRLFRVLVVLAAPCGGDIRKGPFHRKPPFLCVQPYPPRPFPFMGKGAALEDMPPSRPGNGTAGAARKGQAAAGRRCHAPLTDSARPCRAIGGDGG